MELDLYRGAVVMGLAFGIGRACVPWVCARVKCEPLSLPHTSAGSAYSIIAARFLSQHSNYCLSCEDRLTFVVHQRHVHRKYHHGEPNISGAFQESAFRWGSESRW